MKNKVGFTLAEVLITLGIIGIVAELTMPTLVSNYQKQQTIERLKKVYSTLSQAIVASSIDNGPVVDWFPSDVRVSDGPSAKLFTDRYIVPYLRVANYCGNSVTTDCPSYNVYTIAKNNPQFQGYVFNSARSKFFLHDGTLISYSYNSASSGRYEAFIDLNGSAKPNVYGKDVFIYIYYSTNGKFLPMGYQYDRSQLMNSGDAFSCLNQATTYAGWYCGALIMYDGWQIKDDYPW